MSTRWRPSRRAFRQAAELDRSPRRAHECLKLGIGERNRADRQAAQEMGNAAGRLCRRHALDEIDVDFRTEALPEPKRQPTDFPFRLERRTDRRNGRGMADKLDRAVRDLIEEAHEQVHDIVDPVRIDGHLAMAWQIGRQDAQAARGEPLRQPEPSLGIATEAVDQNDRPHGLPAAGPLPVSQVSLREAKRLPAWTITDGRLGDRGTGQDGRELGPNRPGRGRCMTISGRTPDVPALHASVGARAVDP